MSDVHIDLSALQRTITGQIQVDEDALLQLRRQIDQLTARLNANRGKLDLLADLMVASGGEQGDVDRGE